MAALTVYVDGACTANNAKGRSDKSLRHAAFGVFVHDGHPWNEGTAIDRRCKATNQVAEICALRRALQRCLEDVAVMPARGVCIKTDSMYVVNVFTKWAPAWRRNGWVRGAGEPVQNVELIRETLALLERLRAEGACHIELRHVRAHRAEPKEVDRASEEWQDWYGNKCADQLASTAAQASAAAAAATTVDRV